MTTPALHRFLELDDTERTAWIARFVDDPASRTVLYDRPFPALRAGEQPFTWLIDQFRRVKWTEGLPGRIRRPVVDLVVTEGGRHGVRNRPQLLGELLEVAGACELTEVVPPLRAWIRDGRYRDDWYDVPGGRKSVRLITWSLLIGWRQTEGLTDALIRDLERTDLACAQLCFAELGRLAPGEAIERIPSALTWPEPYWREVLRRFLTSLGPRQAISPRYREHWRRCFAEMIWKNRSLVAEAAFEGLLRDVGIAYHRSGTVVRLSLESGISALEVDVAEIVQLTGVSSPEAREKGAVRPQRALEGDEPVLTRLVAALTPVIQARVARGLLLRRSGTAAGRNVRQEVEDLTQETFQVLFADDGQVLRSWQPERGLTLANFVGLVAEQRLARRLLGEMSDRTARGGAREAR